MANLLATCATNYGSSTQCWSSADMKAANFWVCTGDDSFKLDQGGSVFDIWVSDSSISHQPRNILRAYNQGNCIVLGQGCNANTNATIPVYACNCLQSPTLCATGMGRLGCLCTVGSVANCIGGSLMIAQCVMIGAGGTGPSLKVRHIDGKCHTADTPDTLYLQYNTAKNVVVGRSICNANLCVYGSSIATNLCATSRTYYGSNSAAYIHSNGNYLKHQNAHGYIQIGPENSSWAHILTDRNCFYFNCPISVNGGHVRSHDENLVLSCAGGSNARIVIASGTTTSCQHLTVCGVVCATGNLGLAGGSASRMCIGGSRAIEGNSGILSLGEDFDCICLRATCTYSTGNICTTACVKAPIICATTCINSGNVGIGRAASNYPLMIKGNTRYQFAMCNSGSGDSDYPWLVHDNDNLVIHFNGIADRYCFHNSGAFCATSCVKTTRVCSLTAACVCACAYSQGSIVVGTGTATTCVGPFGGWYDIAEISEWNSPTHWSIKTCAHNTLTFTTTMGYHGSNTASINVLNSSYTANSCYIHVNCIRIACQANSTYRLQLYLCRTSATGCLGAVYITAHNLNQAWIHGTSMNVSLYACLCPGVSCNTITSQLACSNTHRMSCSLSVCGSVTTGTLCGTTCARSATVCGTTLVRSPTICGTTAVNTDAICVASVASISGDEDYEGLAIGQAYSNESGWNTQLNMYGRYHDILRIKKCAGGTGDNAQCLSLWVHDNHPATIQSTGNLLLKADSCAVLCATGDTNTTIYYNGTAKAQTLCRGFRACGQTAGCGYLDLCPNGSWGHLITDRSKFYANKPWIVDTGCVGSYDEDLTLHRGYANSTAGERIVITSGTTHICQYTNVAGKLAVNASGLTCCCALNCGKADFEVNTGGTATAAWSGGRFRVGDNDVNWSTRIQQSGYFETYSSDLYVRVHTGNKCVILCPHGTGFTKACGLLCATSCLVTAGNTYSTNYHICAGDGRGVKFWNGSNSYRIYMSAIGCTDAGRLWPNGDYNMYFVMLGNSSGSSFQRGFVWQEDNGSGGVQNLAHLNHQGLRFASTSCGYICSCTGCIKYPFYTARYSDSNENYRGVFCWNKLQLGNNGPNQIVAGDEGCGGRFEFIVNNCADATSNPNGTTALVMCKGGGVYSCVCHQSPIVCATSCIQSGVIKGCLASTSGDGQNNLPFRLATDYNSFMVATAGCTWGLFWAGNSGAKWGTNGVGGPGNIWSNSSNPNEFVFVGAGCTDWTVHGGYGRTWQRGEGCSAVCWKAPVVCATSAAELAKIRICCSHNCLYMASTNDAANYNFAICSMYNWACSLTISNRNVPILKVCSGNCITSLWSNNTERICIHETGAKIIGNLCVTGTVVADGMEGETLVCAGCCTGTICFNTSCVTGLDAVYDIYVSANPNCGGSTQYRDIVHLTSYVTTGWNGSAVTKYINTINRFTRDDLHSSGGSTVTATAKLLVGTTGADSYAVACATCLQVQVSGGAHKNNTCVIIKKVL